MQINGMFTLCPEAHKVLLVPPPGVWDILDEAQERSFLPIRSMLRDGVEYNLRYKENTEDGPENRRRLRG